nr:MAG TPA: hypothetical protein [Bacteriophage sp.]
MKLPRYFDLFIAWDRRAENREKRLTTLPAIGTI